MGWKLPQEHTTNRLPDQFEWLSVAAPPPAYTIVLLAFDDGSVRRGVWNGKLWWGYDERVKRACELHPLRWRLWSETMPSVTRIDLSDLRRIEVTQ